VKVGPGEEPEPGRHLVHDRVQSRRVVDWAVGAEGDPRHHRDAPSRAHLADDLEEVLPEGRRIPVVGSEAERDDPRVGVSASTSAMRRTASAWWRLPKPAPMMAGKNPG